MRGSSGACAQALGRDGGVRDGTGLGRRHGGRGRPALALRRRALHAAQRRGRQQRGAGVGPGVDVQGPREAPLDPRGGVRVRGEAERAREAGVAPRAPADREQRLHARDVGADRQVREQLGHLQVQRVGEQVVVHEDQDLVGVAAQALDEPEGWERVGRGWERVGEGGRGLGEGGRGLGEGWERVGEGWERVGRGWERVGRGWERVGRGLGEGGRGLGEGWERVGEGWERVGEGWERVGRGWERVGRGLGEGGRGLGEGGRGWERVGRGLGEGGRGLGEGWERVGRGWERVGRGLGEGWERVGRGLGEGGRGLGNLSWICVMSP